ncbi:MAG: MBL fold metallo-hydrolase [Candidatus Xenobiia bacterium LiM19]
MIIEQLNTHSCLTYLIGEEGQQNVILIDPVLEGMKGYLQFLERNDYQLTHVIDTHLHADHISGCSALRDLTGCEYVMHTAASLACVTVKVGEDDEIKVGTLPLRFMHTPGHTRNSMCIIVDNAIFTGDTLFLDDGGAGRDDLPGGDAGAHWESLQRIMKLPDHLVVYPSHEYRNRKPSTLGEQKERNPHLRLRSKKEFVNYLEELKLGPAEWMKDVLKANHACAREPGSVWIPVDLHACEVKGTLDRSANKQEVRSITAEALKSMMESGIPLLLLDVRESPELVDIEGHLPGIVHIPIGRLSFRLDKLRKHQKKEIVAVCHSGGRAHTAAQILMQAGFPHVSLLKGGMKAWRLAGYEVERAPLKT